MASNAAMHYCAQSRSCHHQAFEICTRSMFLCFQYEQHVRTPSNSSLSSWHTFRAQAKQDDVEYKYKVLYTLSNARQPSNIQALSGLIEYCPQARNSTVFQTGARAFSITSCLFTGITQISHHRCMFSSAGRSSSSWINSVDQLRCLVLT